MALPQAVNQLPIPNVSYAEAASAEPVQTNGTSHEATSAEYEGEGLDTAPKSPVRGHKKVSSRSSRGSLKQAAKDQKAKSGDEVVYEKVSDLSSRREYSTG